eukprot:4414899-Pleurochrysis_carterae.AAC.1
MVSGVARRARAPRSAVAVSAGSAARHPSAGAPCGSSPPPSAAFAGSPLRGVPPARVVRSSATPTAPPACHTRLSHNGGGAGMGSADGGRARTSPPAPARGCKHARGQFCYVPKRALALP